MIDFSFENETYNLGEFEIILKPVSKGSSLRFEIENNPTNDSMYEELTEGTRTLKPEFDHLYAQLLIMAQKFLIDNCISIKKEGVDIKKEDWFRFFDKALDVAEFREFVEGYKNGQKKT